MSYHPDLSTAVHLEHLRDLQRRRPNSIDAPRPVRRSRRPRTA
jgi:hypothetical protein